MHQVNKKKVVMIIMITNPFLFQKKKVGLPPPHREWITIENDTSEDANGNKCKFIQIKA
jgi:hypothetical protein